MTAHSVICLRGPRHACAVRLLCAATLILTFGVVPHAVIRSRLSRSLRKPTAAPGEKLPPELQVFPCNVSEGQSRLMCEIKCSSASQAQLIPQAPASAQPAPSCIEARQLCEAEPRCALTVLGAPEKGWATLLTDISDEWYEQPSRCHLT